MKTLIFPILQKSKINYGQENNNGTEVALDRVEQAFLKNLPEYDARIIVVCLM